MDRRITPLEIRQKKFAQRFRGYDNAEVEAFLEQVGECMEALVRENVRLKEDAYRLGQENREHKDREDVFRRAVLQSQKVLEKMKSNAEKEAEIIVSEAAVKAERIIQEAQKRQARILEEITQLKGQRVRLLSQLRALLEEHEKLLDYTEDQIETVDQEEDKVAFLKNA
ncbi:MAG: DivIVA domain-containing protein [Desulfatibacillaceae bacterium]